MVTRQTLWDQLYALAQVLTPTYEALRARVLSADVVHADETTWKLLVKKPSMTWYVWGLGSEYGTYYHFNSSRGKGVIKELFKDYQETVMCDGYPAYQSVATESPQLTLVFCWAHVRRRFLEALPSYPQCEQALELIGALYGVERKLPFLYRPCYRRARRGNQAENGAATKGVRTDSATASAVGANARGASAKSPARRDYVHAESMARSAPLCR